MGEPGDPMRTFVLAPEWFAGSLIAESLPVSSGIRSRIKAWNRMWEKVLDPIDEIRWPDPEVGRAWIAEGNALVRDIQAELGAAVAVSGDFADFDPDGSDAAI